MIQFSLLFSLLALCGPVLSSELRAAPYYLPVAPNAQTVDDILTNSGIKTVILAFVLAPNSSTCVPYWDGNSAFKVADDKKVLEFVNTLRSHGGDVSVSFGGADGVELAHACKSPEELAKAYQVVIDKYQLTHIDLDIEGDDLGVAIEEKRRFDAIKILKQNAKKQGKRLVVSLTMPLLPPAMDEMKRAIAEGVDIDLYTPMLFEFGGNSSTLVEQVEYLMELSHELLKTVRTDLNDEQLWNRLGMILMNGHTDVHTELYSQKVFEDLVQYSKQKNLARVSFWSMNRDRACPPSKHPVWLSGSCSSVDQKPFDFSKIVSKFNSV